MAVGIVGRSGPGERGIKKGASLGPVAVECQVFAQDVNALLRGWAAYFRHGHSARPLSRIRRLRAAGVRAFHQQEASPQPPLRLSCDAQRACSTATVAQLNACGRAGDCGRSGTGPGVDGPHRPDYCPETWNVRRRLMYKGLAVAPKRNAACTLLLPSTWTAGVARDERILFCLAYRTALKLWAWS
jgi:Group II intron, maturase-specific domain